MIIGRRIGIFPRTPPQRGIAQKYITNSMNVKLTIDIRIKANMQIRYKFRDKYIVKMIQKRLAKVLSRSLIDIDERVSILLNSAQLN